MAPGFSGYDIFDDKEEVKRLVEFVIQQKDPDVSIEWMRRIDFTYVLNLSKGTANREINLNREEINDSWGWRNGNIDPTLESKIEKVIAEL
jgi:hypothetical protein